MLQSYEDLVAFLVRTKVPHIADPAQRAAELPTVIRGEDGRMVLLWDPRATLVHVIHPLVISVAEDRVAEFVDAVVRVNHALVLPGFGFDHSQRAAYYRWVVPRHMDGGFSEDELHRAINTVLQSCRDFLPALREVAAGRAPGAEVLKVAEATRFVPESG